MKMNKKKVEVLGRNKISTFTRGTIGEWANDDGVWELFYDDDGDYRGVVVSGLNEENLNNLVKDCIDNKGFFDPEFSPPTLDDYENEYSVAYRVGFDTVY